MERSRYEVSTSRPTQFIWISKEININPTPSFRCSSVKVRFTPLNPFRQWLNAIDIRSPKAAKTICQLIPARCPFERTIKLFGRTILYIPPLCKLNPLYEETVALRFRALCYLADECGEDVSLYC